MSAASSGGPLDASLLKQFSAEQLSQLLRQLPGDKDLVLEPGVMAVLNSVCGMDLLKAGGVKRVYKTEGFAAAAASQQQRANTVFIIQASLDQARSCVDVLRSCAVASSSSNVVLVMVPKAPQSVLSLLEEEGLANRVAVREFCWQMIPVDADVLSLELPHFFSQSIADGDHSQLAAVSRTLMDLQLLYGPIPSKVAFGQRSSAVLSQLSLLESKLPPSSSASSTSEIAHLLILDRDSDFDPCLLSPITYESLLDEVYGITLGRVDLSSGASAGAADPSKPEKLELSSRDRVFEQIRHRHFGSIFALLSAHARQLKQAQAKAGAMSVDQMKEFVQTGLRDMRANLKSVAVHIGVSETIQEQKGFIYGDIVTLEQDLMKGSGQKRAIAYLEQAAAQVLPADVSFRLFCLLSRCCSPPGISAADYSRLKKALCDAYGYRHAATLARLERAGLLCPPGSSNDRHRVVRSKLGLASPPSANSRADEDLVQDKDPAYVFSGSYCPAACRLADMMLGSPSSLAELSRSAPTLNLTVQRQSNNVGNGALLVFFVGGFTLAEVSALRALQARHSVPIVVGGTSKECGRTVMQHFIGC